MQNRLFANSSSNVLQYVRIEVRVGRWLMEIFRTFVVEVSKIIWNQGEIKPVWPHPNFRWSWKLDRDIPRKKCDRYTNPYLSQYWNYRYYYRNKSNSHQVNGLFVDRLKIDGDVQDFQIIHIEMFKNMILNIYIFPIITLL